MSGHQAQVPPAVRDYFARFVLDGATEYVDDYDVHPIITETFAPDRGWKRHPFRKRVSASWLRKLRAEGVTHVQLVSPQHPSRRPDFSIRELLR